jgi:hypothetical protein
LLTLFPFCLPFFLFAFAFAFWILDFYFFIKFIFKKQI